MKLKSILPLALMLASACVMAQTVLTPSMTQSQVQAAITAAPAGSTISFSPGPYINITSPLTLTCGVTYTGAVDSVGLMMGISASACASPTWTISLPLPQGTLTSTYLQTLPGSGASTIHVRGTQQFETIGVFSSGPQQIVTPTLYSSYNTNICTVTVAGLVTAVATGTCKVRSTLGSVTSSWYTLSVNP